MIALVAGGTRGAGRGIATELGVLGATVYVTGRTTRESRSPMGRPETIEETAELVSAAGGEGIAVQVDHSDPAQVASLMQGIETLDVLVNDIWGGDPLTQWAPFWKHDLANGILLLRQAVETHIVTSWHAAPKIIASQGLIVEVTDGVGTEGYRGTLFYDLAKEQVRRLAFAQAQDLAPHGATALAITPGFLRSESVLDHFGVTAENWRDAIAKDRHFAASETPRYVGRAVAALATDPDVKRFAGQPLASGDLAREYGFTDVDGSQPHWGDHYAAAFS